MGLLPFIDCMDSTCGTVNCKKGFLIFRTENCGKFLDLKQCSILDPILNDSTKSPNVKTSDQINLTFWDKVINLILGWMPPRSADVTLNSYCYHIISTTNITEI